MTPKLAPFSNAVAFFIALNPGMRLHSWQVRDLMLLSEKHTAEHPCEYYLCAANGSGKDGIMLATWLAWCLVSKPYFKAAVTSASDLQLTTQTENAILKMVRKYNAFVGREAVETKHHHLYCTDSFSNVYLFATNEPGRAEGWHPEALWPGAELAIVMSEMKSIEPEIVAALKRARGYNFWVGVSSPGQPVGDFYNNVKVLGPAPERKRYVSKITAYECPHISAAEIQRLIDEYGINDPLVQSSIFAEFADLVVESICPPDLITTEPQGWNKYGLPITAGIDLSLGGDECVICVQWGNKLIALETMRSRDVATVAKWVVERLAYWGVSAAHAYADAGGIGQPIVQRIADFGARVNEVHSENAPLIDPIRYKTRGAELHGLVVQLLHQRKLIVPTDKALLRQLTTRRWENVAGRLRMEDKKRAKVAGRPHPDRLDAWVLAFSNATASKFNINPHDRVIKAPGNPLPPEVLAMLGISQKGKYPSYESLYGNKYRNLINQDRYIGSGSSY